MSAPVTKVRHIDGTGVDQVLWLVGEQYIITSKGCGILAHETYAFLANADGEVTDWLDLPGSRSGEASHEEVIAGYAASLGGEE